MAALAEEEADAAADEPDAAAAEVALPAAEVAEEAPEVALPAAPPVAVPVLDAVAEPEDEADEEDEPEPLSTAEALAMPQTTDRQAVMPTRSLGWLSTQLPIHALQMKEGMVWS